MALSPVAAEALEVLRFAAVSGRIDLLGWLQHRGQLPEPSDVKSQDLILSAAAGKQTAVITWLLEHQYTLTSDSLNALLQGVGTGSPAFYTACLNATQSYNIQAALVACVVSGSVTALRCLISRSPEPVGAITAMLLVFAAGARGHLPILEFLNEELENSLHQPCVWHNELLGSQLLERTWPLDSL